MSGGQAIAIMFASVVAGLVRGLAGFGGPLLLIPILNLVFTPETTVTAVLLADIIAGLQLVPDAWRQARLRIVGLLLLGTAVSIPVGTALLAWTEPALMKRFISGVILALGVVVLCGWRYRNPLTAPGYVGVGGLAGLVMGATGIAAVAPLFLNAGGESAARNRAHFVLWVLVASLLIWLMLALTTPPTKETLSLILLRLPAYGAGVFVGARVLTRIPDAMLRRGVLILVVTIALAGIIL